AQDIRTDRLDREELARGNLLEGGRMEDKVDTAGGTVDTVEVAHVPDVETDPSVIDRRSHFVLLQLITAEDADLVNAVIEEPANHGGPE
ncbi:MAG TPA: hypothetical protein VFX33_13900, partial [Actinomycetales bacterium]|nr:hypothetical protein [Actinomycetales bacterium]